ncbi:hypothetical protein BLN97_06615 [Bradyrhizobium elkanii]|nr:hypothetical protein BLN97_06615 [Bradyrhizobium elkanii]
MTTPIVAIVALIAKLVSGGDQRRPWLASWVSSRSSSQNSRNAPAMIAPTTLVLASRNSSAPSSKPRSRWAR